MQRDAQVLMDKKRIIKLQNRNAEIKQILSKDKKKDRRASLADSNAPSTKNNNHIKEPERKHHTSRQRIYINKEQLWMKKTLCQIDEYQLQLQCNKNKKYESIYYLCSPFYQYYVQRE